MNSWLALPVAAVLVCGLCGGGRADEGAVRLPPECVPRGGLPNVLRKLEQGGEVRIAYLGGAPRSRPAGGR